VLDESQVILGMTLLIEGTEKLRIAGRMSGVYFTNTPPATAVKATGNTTRQGT
jgi:hypothetical protein